VQHVTETSRLSAPAEAVWARVTTIDGVNDELRPVMRMTAPAHVTALNERTIVVGERLFRSWILLLGVLPVDYDDLTIVEVEPGRRFLERSPMLSMRSWEHERIVEPDGDGCTLTDRLTFAPRVPVPAAPLIRALFRHRHRRLRRRFGSLAGP
jgi:ligand-binding SRPBCC domain-containing protein